MMHYLLFALFFILFASESLGINTSLAPGLSVKNAFLYLIFLMLAVETAITGRRKLELLPVFVPFVVYILYAIFTWLIILLLLKYPGYDLRRTLFMLKSGAVEHLMVLLMFFYGTSDTRRAIWLLKGILSLIVVANVVSLIDVLNIVDLGLVRVREDGRMGGTIGNANEFAAFLALFLPAIIALAWTTVGWKRLAAGVGAFLSCLAFLMAVSRGAIVGLAGGAVLGAFYLRRNIPPGVFIRAGSAVFLLCIVSIAAALVAGYGDVLFDRFSAFGGGAFEASSGRTMLWERALEKMLDHPLTFVTGFGWEAYRSDSYFNLQAHSHYVDLLYNLGIIGVGLFLLTVANALGVARVALTNAGTESRPFLIAFVIGFMGLMVTLVFNQLPSTWLYIWAFAGISLRLAVSETEVESAIAPDGMGATASRGRVMAAQARVDESIAES